MTTESPVSSLQRGPRLVDEVAARLRDRITDGTLSAGTRLPQVVLAEQLGVSRTPLREALRLLENDGLLKTVDNNRTVEVVTVGPDDLLDMYQLREVIDGLAAKLAAQHGFSAEEASLAQHLLNEMAESSDPYDPVRRNRAHTQFHEMIAVASHNTKVQSFAPLIRTSSAALYMPLNRAHAEASLLAEDPAKSYKQILDESQVQHREIIEAILAREPAAAEAAARHHIQRTIRLAPHFG
ncbi:GntR family transcriptional regulator [Mycolicibacterium hodleri]|uniref:GntR family transcriptional regulator n=1 Tax=Mycolicibacterium hodleri TaxID=49897 RepID=A0A502E4M6_9MYCO|nr:GntR family transcriptional regulator [Mycolicibacterium hodleri]TPG32457.1 GntR family transcriptional regulator [Mycolicibacterium hodleri]